MFEVAERLHRRHRSGTKKALKSSRDFRANESSIL
jgi:hypothetical protein